MIDTLLLTPMVLQVISSGLDHTVLQVTFTEQSGKLAPVVTIIFTMGGTKLKITPQSVPPMVTLNYSKFDFQFTRMT